MTNIYEEAYKEAEIKIKKLSEDFKKDLDKILKECTKKKPEDLKKQNAKLKTDCRTLAQKLLQVKPELREWLEVNYGEYL